MPLTPSFLFDFESEMQRITENEYARMVASDALWWRDLTKVRTTGKRKEIIAWLLSTAQIRSQGKGGNINYDDMAAAYFQLEVLNAGEALRLKRDQVEDNDGGGFDFAAEWSSQMGAQMAYWPQKSVAQLLLNGTASTSKTYDGVPFFTGTGTPHPYNQFQPGRGGFANVFTGAAATPANQPPYPGALPIDSSVTVDVALQNIQKAIAYIASIKMPNGVDPRFLRPQKLLVPPALVARAQQLVNARFIAQPAAGGAGSADISAIVSNWGLGQPLEIQELAGATYADSSNPDTTWFIATQQVTNTNLGAFVYLDREPFKITYYTGQGGGTGVDAFLDRARELEWHCQGRNVAGYGHPYAMFMAKGA